MKLFPFRQIAVIVLLVVSQFIFAADDAPSRQEHSVDELAKAVQNPIANLISVPFQNNTSFEFGPEEKTQNVLNI